LWFIGLIALQVFVLSNTHLFGVFLPFVYVYVLLRWPPDVSKTMVVLMGFLLGLSVDVLSNTPGMHAAATTLMGFLRYPVLRLFVSKEELGSREIGLASLGSASFWKYATVLVLVHHSALFLLEGLAPSNLPLLLLKIAVCTVLTLLFIMAFERINRKKDARF
jgi:rod shape-determining protein MreD